MVYNRLCLSRIFSFILFTFILSDLFFVNYMQFSHFIKKLFCLSSSSPQQYLPGLVCDFTLQPVHQRCDQSLLGVVGGEDQQHGVPGQTLKTGHTAGLSGEERVTEDHSLLDTPEAPQQVQDLRHASLSAKFY